MGVPAIYWPGLRGVEVYVELDSLVSIGIVGFGNSRGQAITVGHIHIAIKPEQQAEGPDPQGN